MDGPQNQLTLIPHNATKVLKNRGPVSQQLWLDKVLFHAQRPYVGPEYKV